MSTNCYHKKDHFWLIIAIAWFYKWAKYPVIHSSTSTVITLLNRPYEFCIISYPITGIDPQWELLLFPIVEVTINPNHNWSWCILSSEGMNSTLNYKKIFHVYEELVVYFTAFFLKNIKIFHCTWFFSLVMLIPILYFIIPRFISEGDLFKFTAFIVAHLKSKRTYRLIS